MSETSLLGDVIVSIEHFGQVKQIPLCNALRPTESLAVLEPDGGIIESLQTFVKANAEAIGRLLAHLVGNYTLTLEQAFAIAGVSVDRAWVPSNPEYGEVTKPPDPPIVPSYDIPF